MIKFAVFTSSIVLMGCVQAAASGSSGGSGGSQGAAGGSTPRLESGVSGKMQRDQEAKILELQRAAAQPTSGMGFDHSHMALTEILGKSVRVLREGRVTQVDYKSVDALKLKSYVDSLSAVTRPTYNAMTRDQKLAFLINAYNAFTVQLIVQNSSVKSIKDLGSFLSSPWKKKIVPLFGETVSLDDVEHGMIRKDPQFQEPRIHFAVNCASIGCPALLNEAFTADRLDEQLNLVTKNFLRDRDRNRVDGNKVVISKIFDWYSGDFEKSWKGIVSVNDFLAKHADALADNPDQQKLLREMNFSLSYSDYDWALNKVSP